MFVTLVVVVFLFFGNGTAASFSEGGVLVSSSMKASDEPDRMTVLAGSQAALCVVLRGRREWEPCV